MREQCICMGQSYARDARQAAREFHSQIMHPDLELVVFFCSSKYCFDELAAEMRQLFGQVQIVGCTTAGEFGPGGYGRNSLSGVGFLSDGFWTASGLLTDLGRFNTEMGNKLVQGMLQELEGRVSLSIDGKNSFALLLVDGMSMREELVAHSLQSSLGQITLLGGSAGDDGEFVKTWVYSNGEFHANSAVLILVTTSLPFTTFLTQHFVSGDERMVVTEADPANRIVREINGLAAAEVYAGAIGVSVNDLGPGHFAASPVVVRIAEADYVRSIQKVNPDGSLTFYCAIDRGVILRVARGEGLVNNLECTFNRIRREVGEPQCVIGVDCILRNQEVVQKDLLSRVGDLFRSNNVVGFNSYGEQMYGLHVNQTFAGVALGRSCGASKGKGD